MTTSKTKLLEPLLNRVVLKQLKKATSESGFLDIAPSGQKSADRAEVIAVGPGMFNVETEKYIAGPLKVGDVVLINAMYGMRAKLDGEDVIIQREDEILCRELTV